MKKFYITLKKYENIIPLTNLPGFQQVVFNDYLEISDFIEKNHKEAEKIIVLDADACYLFMYLTKIKGLVVAPTTDEHSSFMTLSHNNTKVIVIPMEIVAKELAESIIENYINSEYEGGRHKVRIDMLDKELD